MPMPDLLFSGIPAFTYDFFSIQYQYQWHQHSGIWHLSPVPEHSGTGLDPGSQEVMTLRG
jgi:hypothetical protein